MQFRTLGSTGISVSEIGFGAWAIGGPVDLFGIPVGWGPVDDTQSLAALEKAWDSGINFFDTADVYGSGHSEELIGKCEKIKHGIVATKVGNTRTAEGAVKDFSRKHIFQAIEDSLRRLRREAIDLYQLHNPPSEVLQQGEVFETLNLLKQQGKIRFGGVSIAKIEDGLQLVQQKKVDCLQVLLNILNQEPAKKLIPLAEKNGLGIVVRVPLASGLLTGKFSSDSTFANDDVRKNFLSAKRIREVAAKVDHLKSMASDARCTLAQLALAFVLKHSGVSVTIPGAKTITQVEENASASDVLLTDSVFERIRKEYANYNFYLRYKVRV